MGKNKKDVGYTLAKAGIASIPIVGAAAAEILPLIITPPIEKRREVWMLEVGERLQALEKQRQIKLESLSENDIFVDTVLKISSEALKTSEREKLKYFKNAIVNTAVSPNPDISEINIFVRLITEFTIWHIKILKLFDNPEECYRINEKEFAQYSMVSLSKILFRAYPILYARQDFCDLIWADLGRWGLHNTSDLKTGVSASGLKSSRTTELGKKFLLFIEDQADSK